MPPLWPPSRTRTRDWQDPAQIRARLSLPILPLASSQCRSPVTRCAQPSATCTRDKAILHLSGCPSSAKSRPRPLTEDRVHGAFQCAAAPASGPWLL